MPLVHLSNMINHACRYNYAVGAFGAFGVAKLYFLEGILLFSAPGSAICGIFTSGAV